MNDSFPSLSSDKYIGFLLIPSLELSLPVQSKWGNTMLKDAPCRYAGTIEGKNIIIAGHNYQSHFGRLKYLNIGDTVSLVTLEGTEYLYAISDIEVLGSTDLEEMKTGDWDLTLFTCTTRGTQRLTIRCVSQ